MKKIRTVGIAALIVLWAALALSLWFGSKADYAYSERRPLAQMPELTAKSIFSGKFTADFEDFTLDQFPLRDSVRKVKSLFHYHVLNQSDNNGIYLVDDTVAALEYPLNPSSMTYASGKFQYLYDTWLKDTDCKLYFTMIPDKGYYLAQENGYLAMDYAALEAGYQEALNFAAYIDIKPLLTGEDYYRTDTHWRQEKILDVAQTLCLAMNVPIPNEGDYTRVALEEPFYGVYFGQAALPMEPEQMYLLRSPLLDGCTVNDLVTGKQTPVYDLDKLTRHDLYDVYLSGAQPLLEIHNPQGDPDRELVIFRDSFSSALTPLLLAGYGKVTLVDIRYVPSSRVGEYVTFADQDVLFAYSTLILNNSRTLT